MRKILVAAFVLCSFMSFAQTNPLKKAEDSAKLAHKNILVQFSGSDWCIPCIKMEKAIFSQSSFKQFADSSLVMLHADFPRNGKISKQQQKENEALAATLNKQGSFPYTVLLDESGKVLKVWNGYKDQSASSFIDELRNFAVQHVN